MAGADCTTMEPTTGLAPAGGADLQWPPQVDLILSALETGQHPLLVRRRGRRVYRVLAKLRLFSDSADTPPWVLYTRDSSARGLGFITTRRLPLGHGGQVELPDPAGLTLHIDCVLSRCRETAPGWYEGGAAFQP